MNTVPYANPIYAFAGNSRTLAFAVPTTVNLTNAVGAWWLVQNAEYGPVYVRKDTGANGGVTFQNGTMIVQLYPQDTAHVFPQGMYHEAEIVENDGTTTTIAAGYFKLEPTVIREPFMSVASPTAVTVTPGVAQSSTMTPTEVGLPAHTTITPQQAVEGRAAATAGAPTLVSIQGGLATAGAFRGAAGMPGGVAVTGRTAQEGRTAAQTAVPNVVSITGGIATGSKNATTPGGGSGNTANFADPNNAYLVAMAA